MGAATLVGWVAALYVAIKLLCATPAILAGPAAMIGIAFSVLVWRLRNTGDAEQRLGDGRSAAEGPAS